MFSCRAASSYLKLMHNSILGSQLLCSFKRIAPEKFCLSEILEVTRFDCGFLVFQCFSSHVCLIPSDTLLLLNIIKYLLSLLLLLNLLCPGSPFICATTFRPPALFRAYLSSPQQGEVKMANNCASKCPQQISGTDLHKFEFSRSCMPGCTFQLKVPLRPVVSFPCRLPNEHKRNVSRKESIMFRRSES